MYAINQYRSVGTNIEELRTNVFMTSTPIKNLPSTTVEKEGTTRVKGH